MYLKYFKSMFDQVFSLLILLATLPILFVIFLLIKLDGGPALFFHTRIGKNGKKIKVIKFRTMVVNAEEKLQYLLDNDQGLARQWRRSHKLENDPRVTKIGAVLRKTHFDEFPQFINVIIGDMSVIGPRPITEQEFEIHFLSKQHIKTYQSVKPGITGSWQTGGEVCENYQERIELELKYIQNINFTYDISIALKTVQKIFK